VAGVKIKLKVPATQHHRRKRPAPAHWRAISNVRFLFGLTTYYAQCVYGRCPCVLNGLILFVEFFIVVVFNVFIAVTICMLWIIGGEVNKMHSLIHYIFSARGLAYGYKILEYLCFRICIV
jgi:hypothetical protein